MGTVFAMGAVLAVASSALLELGRRGFFADVLAGEPWLHLEIRDPPPVSGRFFTLAIDDGLRLWRAVVFAFRGGAIGAWRHFGGRDALGGGCGGPLALGGSRASTG
jgi:hypothetical protein